jgi:N-acyl-D-amino-acid deacylase
MVYARGFGYADVESREPVQPQSRFRIASISKPITAVAVMQLVEQGKLKLDDKVLEVLKLQPRRVEGTKGDARLLEVTVRHCLEHTGGWDRDRSFDPMFRSVAFARELNLTPPAKACDVIECMLGVPLDFAPGERYAYSNYGYCLLGRVIEQLSGKSYEEYVRESVLAPLGIRDMQIGKTLPEGRAAGEVKYYDGGKGPAVVGEMLGEPVPHPYGAWYLEAMDSHGGWIASAEDLVKFAASFDVPAACPILKPESIAAMFSRPAGPAGYEADGKPKAAYYGLGWNVRPVGENGANTWHTGSLPGTSTLLVRRHDGLDWCVLFNRRDGKDAKRMSAHADQAINQALNSIDWALPDHVE